VKLKNVYSLFQAAPLYVLVIRFDILFSFGLQTEDVFNEIDFCFSYLVDRLYLPVLRLFLIFKIGKKNLLTRQHYVNDSRIIKQRIKI